MSSTAPFVSYAQHGEDVILWRALGEQTGIFYVDVGAYDPTTDSVTRALYERGWRGINIDAQPDLIEAFDRERPDDINLACAIGAAEGTAPLTLCDNAGWASLLDSATTGATNARTIDVPVRRLSTVLAEHGITQVDVLKVDVEGAEPGVIRGLLDGVVRPRVCVIEGVAPGVGRASGDIAVHMLTDAGYVHCLFDGLNHYLTNDPQLVTALSVPAGPLDFYVTDLHNRLMTERLTLHETIARLATENLELRTTPPVRHDDASAPGTPDTPTPPTKPGATPKQAPILFDPVVRSRRRRTTFAQVVRGDAATSLSEPSAVVDESTSPLPGLLSLASTDRPTREVVSLLYRVVLGRKADPEGLDAWGERLEKGESLLRVVRDLASSREALNRPAADRARIQADLATWESLATLATLGTPVWRPSSLYSLEDLADRIYVAALFEVTLRRCPEPDELTFEIAKLANGSGREWLLRAFAHRRDVRDRFLGIATTGMRARLRRMRYSRTYIATIRTQVALAESRQVTMLLAPLTAPGWCQPDATRQPTSSTEER